MANDARIDLHTHSVRSDGRGTPAQVMREAKDAGLDIVALTDHDTVAGWDEARAEAQRIGLGFVPGIELTTRVQRDTQHKFTVHLLAYLPDPENEALKRILGESVSSRVDRLQAITERLSADFDITWEHVLEVLADGKVAGRPAIADAMIERGIIDSREPFFDWVRPGTKYYVPNRGVPETVDAIGLVRAAGGVPIVAHPMARGGGPKPGEPMPRAHFLELIDAGLAGFEAHHRDVPAHATEWFVQLAAEFNLLVTGSSDYHGTGKPNLLGENLTPPATLAAIIAQSTNPSLASLSHGIN
ncbi:MAG: PHP domain-containing protein [Actinomycetales bacterium]|nr:PHP domain-containing protein [Actinomycetales bacterium]